MERRLGPFRKKGLHISGYLGQKKEEREDKISVRILKEKIGDLKEKALILIMVGNLTGKKWIQGFLDRHSFKEGEDYLWMV